MYVCMGRNISDMTRQLTTALTDEILHRHMEPDTKESFRWGSKSNKGIPYFYPKLAPT